MSTASSEPRLVDMEFKPDELPTADLSSLMVPEEHSQLAGSRSPHLAVRLMVGALAAFLGLYLVDSAVTFAVKAVTERSILNAAYLIALLGLVGPLIHLAVQQAKALRELRSAEHARDVRRAQAGIRRGSGGRARRVFC